jgi:hypothetical protein
MSEDNLRAYRRTSRVTISIPVVISGLDADGNSFSESVRTHVINDDGGEIAMAHRLAVGTEVLVENRAIGVVAKANVLRSGKKDHAQDLRPVVVRLLEAQNVWGIAFPPDYWRPAANGWMLPMPMLQCHPNAHKRCSHNDPCREQISAGTESRAGRNWALPVGRRLPCGTVPSWRSEAIERVRHPRQTEDNFLGIGRQHRQRTSRNTAVVAPYRPGA